MIVALIDSGLGMLPTAARLRESRPELDLVLMMDPDNAPWGPKPDAWVVERVVGTARHAVELGAEVVVLPCNTASVTALSQVRAALGDAIPVVGTVPAIKPAAAVSDRIAIWATAATTASAYQARLIDEFASRRTVTSVACHGLADSIDRGDSTGIRAAIDAAVAATPDDVESIVLGCTHYPLVLDDIVADRNRIGRGVAERDRRRTTGECTSLPRGRGTARRCAGPVVPRRRGMPGAFVRCPSLR